MTDEEARLRRGLELIADGSWNLYYRSPEELAQAVLDGASVHGSPTDDKPS